MDERVKTQGFADSFEGDTFTMEIGKLSKQTAPRAAEAYAKGLENPGMKKSLIVVHKECNMLGKDFQAMWKEASEIPSDFVAASAIVVPSVVIKFLLEKVTDSGETKVEFFLKREDAENWLKAQ
ncbi:MAG: hypothetical protein WDA53_01170 [Bacillota bacterium]